MKTITLYRKRVFKFIILQNFIIHPVLNTESSPILVEPTYSKELPQDEPAINLDDERLYNIRIGANGYVCLPDIAGRRD